MKNHIHLIIVIIVFLFLFSSCRANEEGSQSDPQQEVDMGASPSSDIPDGLHYEDVPIVEPPNGLSVQEAVDQQWAESGKLPPSELEELFAQTPYGTPSNPLYAYVHAFANLDNGRILAGGQGGAYVWQQQEDGLWTGESIGPDGEFLVYVGVTPDGTMLASGEYGAYYHVPGASEWSILYDPEAEGHSGVVFDVHYDADLDLYVLATGNGVLQGHPDRGWTKISPDDPEQRLAVWSVEHTEEGYYFGGQIVYSLPEPEIILEQTADQDSDNPSLLLAPPQSEEQTEWGAVWTFLDGTWAEEARFEQTPVIRSVTHTNLYGIAARGQDVVHLQSLDWESTAGFDVYAGAVMEDDGKFYLGMTNESGNGVRVIDDSYTVDYPLPPDYTSLNVLAITVQNGEIIVSSEAGPLVLKEDGLQLLPALNTEPHAKQPNQEKSSSLAKPNSQNTNGYCPVSPQNQPPIYFASWRGNDCNGTCSGAPLHFMTYSSRTIEAFTGVSHGRASQWYCHGPDNTWKTGGDVADRDGDPTNNDVWQGSNNGGACSGHRYSFVWTDTPGYQLAFGESMNGAFTNGQSHHIAIELVPSDFGDLAAQTASSFPVTDFYFRQHHATYASSEHTRGNTITFERTPNDRDSGDDSLQVYLNGSWRNVEAARLVEGMTYTFRLVNLHQRPAWGSQPYVQAWIDYNDTASGAARMDTFGSSTVNPSSTTFNHTIPYGVGSNSGRSRWIRVTISREMPEGYWDMRTDSGDVITGEIEDYQIFVETPTTNLTIDKSSVQGSFAPGQSLEWIIRVQNTSNQPALQVQVVDNIPSGLTYSGLTFLSPQWSCVYYTGQSQVRCLAPPLGAGATGEIRIRTTVAAGYSGTSIANTASVSTPIAETSYTDNQDTHVVTSSSDDLALTITDSADPVSPGDSLNYIVTITNQSSSTSVSNIQVSGGPSGGTSGGLTITSVTPQHTSFSWDCFPGRAGLSFSCTSRSGSLGPGQSTSFTIGATVSANITTSSVQMNGTVSDTDPLFLDVNPSNNSDSETTAIQGATADTADLTVVKSASSSSVVAGDDFSYTINVTNNGPMAAQNVVVSDTLPADVVYRNVFYPASWSCGYNAGTRTVTCTKPTLANGATETITIAVTLSSTATNSVANTATVTSSTPDPTPGNGSSTSTITPGVNADGAITITDDQDPVNPGDTYNYIIDLANNGPSDAYDIVVTYTIPNGLTYLGATAPSGWSCTFNAGTSLLTCTTPMAPSGASGSIVVSVQLDSNYTGTTIDNFVECVSSTPDSDLSNNSDTETTSVNSLWSIAVPNAMLFPHVKVDPATGVVMDSATADEYDYRPEEIIPYPLQVPLGFGIGLHAYNYPTLCTALPCSAPGSLVNGNILVSSFSITHIENVDTGDVWEYPGHATEFALNRYADPNAPCENGACVAFGFYNRPDYEWINPNQYLYLYWQHPDGEPLECPSGYRCWSIEGAEPGFYRIHGFVTINVEFPGYPSIQREYVFPGTFDFQILTSFAQPFTK